MIESGGGGGGRRIQWEEGDGKKEKRDVKRSVGCFKVLINESATRSRSCDVIISCLLCVDSF